MTETGTEGTITSPKGGTLTTLHLTAADEKALLIFGHGAGANIHHAHMQSIATSLASVGISTLRFNFPYMEAGGGRTDNAQTCIESFANALSLAHTLTDKPKLIGGHSFGGRMSSHYAAETGDANVVGLIFYSFPLHPSGKPGTTRAKHLPDINVPMLFLSGTRDKLAEEPLLTETTTALSRAEVHWLDTADHSFKILKRTRTNPVDVYTEAAMAAAGFVGGLA